MEINRTLKKILYSSGFLAIIPALILVFFLPSFVSKYSLVIEPGTVAGKQFMYEDMNGDSISETVQSGKGSAYNFITIRDMDSHFYDQWNLTDSLEKNISGIFFGDYDHDRQKEVYIFSHKGDSLFLNVNEMLQPRGLKLERIFITTLGYINNEVTSSLNKIGFFDENGDGKDEVYFEISSGFRMDPRRVYYFDLVNKQVKSSPFTGIICLFPKMEDVDGDNQPEIFGTLSACGNFGRNVPYSDSSTWFMVFNKDLNFEFPPEEFRGYVNTLEIERFVNKSFRGYVVSHSPMGTDTTVMTPRVMIYSSDGKLIRYRLYSDLGLSGRLALFTSNSGESDRIYIYSDRFTELNENLDAIRTVNLPFKTLSATYRTDIDADGTDEFLFYSEDEGILAVYSENLEKLCEASVKTLGTVWKISQYYGKGNQHKIFINSENSGNFVTFRSNRFYYLGFLAYPGVYLLFFIFIVLIKKINTLQVVEKESLNRRLLTLQLQGIKSQLDPHFTFNVLNSISSLIYMENRQLAYDYMNKFTHLLRSLINDAEKLYRSLGEELEFVSTYLDLEKLRFGEKFNYSIEIGQNITKQEQVPKLVLQTFAENAIKHGIMSYQGEGRIKIEAKSRDGYLILSVEDNGIGMVKSRGQSDSTGKGLKLTGEFYDILNQINKKPIKHLIIDLYDENHEAAGTRVEVWVPLDV
jgi:two-component sensor histidine kinase